MHVASYMQARCHCLCDMAMMKKKLMENARKNCVTNLLAIDLPLQLLMLCCVELHVQPPKSYRR